MIRHIVLWKMKTPGDESFTTIERELKAQVDRNEVTGEEDPTVRLIDFADPARNTFHAMLDHATDGDLHAFGIVRRRGQQDFVVILDGNVLKDLHDLGEERIGDLRDNQAENTAAS